MGRPAGWTPAGLLALYLGQAERPRNGCPLKPPVSESGAACQIRSGKAHVVTFPLVRPRGFEPLAF